jgi:hypothetical protein
VPGLLRAVDCGRDAVLLQVEANGRTFHLTARRFDDIEIISYVSSAPASLSCGVLSSPARVLATYHPLAAAVGGIDGQAVAIELIPESYIPRD